MMPWFQLIHAENELRKAASIFSLCGLIEEANRLDDIILELENFEEDLKAL